MCLPFFSSFFFLRRTTCKPLRVKTLSSKWGQAHSPLPLPSNVRVSNLMSNLQGLQIFCFPYPRSCVLSGDKNLFLGGEKNFSLILCIKHGYTYSIEMDKLDICDIKISWVGTFRGKHVLNGSLRGSKWKKGWETLPRSELPKPGCLE